MADQDTSIQTGSGIKDGGMVLDQNDVNNYVRVLIEQRNDATDALSIYRTKCVRYVAMLESASEQFKELNGKNHELTEKLKVYEPSFGQDDQNANTN